MVNEHGNHGGILVVGFRGPWGPLDTAGVIECESSRGSGWCELFKTLWHKKVHV
jgi:hypothetical protein